MSPSLTIACGELHAWVELGSILCGRRLKHTYSFGRFCSRQHGHCCGVYCALVYGTAQRYSIEGVLVRFVRRIWDLWRPLQGHNLHLLWLCDKHTCESASTAQKESLRGVGVLVVTNLDLCDREPNIACCL